MERVLTVATECTGNEPITWPEVVVLGLVVALFLGALYITMR